MLALALAAPGASARTQDEPAVAVDESAPAGEPEVLHYQWRLKGLRGALLSLFFPGHGDGVITVTPRVDGRVTCEVRLTSERAKPDEYWTYGSITDPTEPRTFRVWNSYFYRGKNRNRSAELGGEKVIDVTSGIHYLRHFPPDLPLRLKIWSGGKSYPVIVLPRGTLNRFLHGERIEMRHFHVRGLKVPGERYWGGSVEVWFGTDEPALPLEIVFNHGLGRVHLKLTGVD